MGTPAYKSPEEYYEQILELKKVMYCYMCLIYEQILIIWRQIIVLP